MKTRYFEIFVFIS